MHNMDNKIKGVNLGNWLVLEKWMDHSLFEGVDSPTPDETSFSTLLGDKKYERLKYHRDHFITERDFAFLAANGVNSVRIPVAHWIFGDTPPYVGGIEYLDRAFDWAEKHRLSVLIDLHCAPGCQNGFDNGGITNVCEWSKSKENIDRTLVVIEELAKRYKSAPTLYGIELLNEPRWDNDDNIVRNFYLRGYDVCRRYLDENRAVVFHDQFKFKSWKDFMQTPEYKNIVLDTHFYQCFGTPDRNSSGAEHIKHVFDTLAPAIKEMNQYFNIIVGEWSLGLPDEAYAGCNSFSANRLNRTFLDAQLYVYENCLGWYFWSYKVNSNMVGWNFRQLVEDGLMKL